MKYKHEKAEFCAICDEGWVSRIIEIRNTTVNDIIVYVPLTYNECNVCSSKYAGSEQVSINKNFIDYVINLSN